MIHLYGIPNCDKVRAARGWLEARAISHSFHDYRKDGADQQRLRRWSAALGWEALINRRGTTFRKLAEANKGPLDADKAILLMAEHPSLIRRPVVEYDGGLLIGFDETEWAQRLA